MSSIYKKLFNGYLLVLLDIRLGTFDILMDPLGYLIILSAIILLYKKEKLKEVKLAFVLTVFMMIHSIIPYFVVTTTTGINLSIYGYISLIASMICNAVVCVVIYFISLRYVHDVGDIEIKNRVEKEGNIYALINGLLILALSTVMIIPLNAINTIIMTTVIIGFILQIRFLFTLSKLKNIWTELEVI